MHYLHDEEGKEDWDGQDWSDEITHPSSIRGVNSEASGADEQVELDNDGYVLDWKSISNRRRAEKDYTCEECKVRLRDQLKLLHVHHIDRDKLDNSPQNLRVLCVVCHSNCEGHEHLAETISPSERTFIELRRALQQRLPANNKNKKRLPHPEDVARAPNVVEPSQNLSSKVSPSLTRKEIQTWYCGYWVKAMYWRGSFRARGILSREKRQIDAEGSSISDVISKIKALIDEDEKEKLPERHKSRIEKIGLPYHGIRQSSASSHRITHCYACKSTLDNDVDIECVACGWIICGGCAACGCGYTGLASY